MHALIASLVYRTTWDAAFAVQLKEDPEAAIAAYEVNGEDLGSTISELTPAISAASMYVREEGRIASAMASEGWFAPMPASWASLVRVESPSRN